MSNERLELEQQLAAAEAKLAETRAEIAKREAVPNGFGGNRTAWNAREAFDCADVWKLKNKLADLRDREIQPLRDLVQCQFTVGAFVHG